MKERAYSALTEKMKTVDPQANKETVLKKINNLRSSFRKERKKVLMAKSGMSTEDLYVPKLWYYNDLLFLVDQEEALDGFSSLLSDTEVSGVMKNNFYCMLTMLKIIHYNVKHLIVVCMLKFFTT
jgi:hypothetical protein